MAINNPVDLTIEQFEGLGEAIDGVIDGFKSLLDQMDKLGADLSGKMSQAVKAVTAAMSKLPGSSGPSRVGDGRPDREAGRPENAPAAAGPLDPSGLMNAAVSGMAASMNAMTTQLSGSLAAASEMIGQVTKGFSSMVGSLGAFANAITAVPSAMQAFVGALAPGLLTQFNYAVRTLQATIGSALAPAFQVFTGMIQTVAGLIAPLMAQLAPVLQTLASTVASLVLPIVRGLAAELSAVLPLFKLVADGLQALTPILDAFAVVQNAVVSTLGDLLGSFLGGNALKSAMESFRSAIGWLAKEVVLLSARFALLFGATGFVDNMIKALKDQLHPATGVAPAPEGAGFTSLDAIGKSLAEASFAAGGGGPTADPNTDLLRDMLGELRGLKQRTLTEEIRGALGTWWAVEWVNVQQWASWFWPFHGSDPSGGGPKKGT